MKERSSISAPSQSLLAHAHTERDAQRQQYRKQLERALDDEDDPLAVYHQFVQWTIKNYGEGDPNSGLLELLEEATRKFKDDTSYKADLRYLKIWTLYARHVEPHGALAIYKYLMTNEIGVAYSLLYEEYANTLEHEGRKQDAETIYRRGIKRQVRPLERLKSRYKDFQARASSASSTPPSSSQTFSKSSGNPLHDALRKNPFRNYASNSASNTTKSSSVVPVNMLSTNSTAASRYALMLAPPAPGKRPEKLRFNLSLLFSDGVEYSIQEARARSMGLLGKKWGPPPVSESRHSSSLATVDFNDDGLKSTKNMGKKKSLMAGAEPTVTINTKEALADVFGMYNSPDKTNIIPGSKHAPVKKIEPMAPFVAPRLTFARENENNAENAKTPIAGFRPFVDENAQPSRVTPASKFVPYVDADARRTPLITPRPVLVTKGVAATPLAQDEDEANSKPGWQSVAEDKPPEAVFSKVFAPLNSKVNVHRDVHTESQGKFKPKSSLEHDVRSHSHVSETTSKPRTFTPLVDENAKTPFKVFSRPPEAGTDPHPQNVFTPKTPGATFTPLVDKIPAFTPFRDSENAPAPLRDKPSSVLSSTLQPLWNAAVEDEDQEKDETEDSAEEADEQYYGEEGQYEGGLADYEEPLDEQEINPHDQHNYYREPPLGGRFGQFNVMTPIVERTCEFTMSTRGGITPKENYYESAEDGGSPRSNVFIPSQIGEKEAFRAAEKLAAELREGADRDQETNVIEERTASLSLAEKLSLNQSFRPSNPCNPFDPAILSSLLSRIPSDSQFFDLRDCPSEQWEALQKFAKKAIKPNGTSRKSSDINHFTLDLNGHHFILSEKLGEGGFGSVFKARDLGRRTVSEDVDDDDDDLDLDDEDEGASMVAIKVVRPRNTWEYHVLKRLHTSLPPSLRRSLVLPHTLYAYSDESFLVLDLCPQGMLLTVINNAMSAGVSQQGACLDELLVMFFSIELIRLVEGMHTAGFIHGDLKIDNCLLRLEDIPDGPSAWSSIYQPSGEGGWSYKGLKVIDFGRTIDTRLFPVGQQFVGDWAPDERDCFELREQRPWTYQTDYFGLAGIIYCMLFGKYIQESSVVRSNDRYKISTPMKRYWQNDIWNRLFDMLLNPCLIKATGELPICNELAGIRKEMEMWLQANCNRSSNTLKGLLKKVEKSCYTS